MSIELGYVEGDVCNRNGCHGIVAEHPVENCSCHIDPPCSECTSDRSYCSECDWEGKDDVRINDYVGYVNNDSTYPMWTPRHLDPSKLDWHSKPHSNSSMIKEGVYPEGMGIKDVEKEVAGTFGGRFEYFRDGKFKYIAYTD